MKLIYNWFDFIIFFLIFTFSFLLIFNTGIHSDDYNTIVNFRKINNFYDFLFPWQNGINFIFTAPLTYYLFWWIYFIADFNNIWMYELFKGLIHICSYYFIYFFMRDYLEKNNAIIFSFCFVFFPLHEVTIYWFMTSPYTLLPALIMFSHYLINKNNKLLGFIIGSIASFISYGSPPYFIGLSIIFIFKNNLNKFFIFLLPNIIFIFFYFFIKVTRSDLENRIEKGTELTSYLKNFYLQVLSSFDSISISYFIKIYESSKLLDTSNIFLTIIIFLIFFLVIFNKKIDKTNKSSNLKILFISFIIIFITSALMFSLTGLYTQSTFNLGNRGTVYISLIFVTIFCIFKSKFVTFFVIIVLFIVPTVGLNKHWKDWNTNQINIINNIKNNDKLKNLNNSDLVLTYGNNYSKLGDYSHIEFLSMPWVVDTLFKEYTNINKVISLNSNLIIKDSFIEDPKFLKKIYFNNINIFFYNTITNELRSTNILDLKKIIKEIEKDKRHWLQGSEIKLLKDLVIYLSPRLIYLFD